MRVPFKYCQEDCYDLLCVRSMFLLWNYSLSIDSQEKDY